VIDRETFDDLLPVAFDWAKAQEQFVLARGTPLTDRYLEDAGLVGVRDAARVRVLVVDRIPMPEHKELAEAARRTQIISNSSRGVTIGHGIIIRADCWGDRELIVHQLVHVAQCERCGGLEGYVQQYLSERQNCPQFTPGSFEEEARRVAHEICAAHAAA
jgi:hypothetical protein